MNHLTHRENFLTLMDQEAHVWTAGWSAQLADGLKDVIWDNAIEGIKKIHSANDEISTIMNRTLNVYQASQHMQSPSELDALGQETTSLWEEYYTNTERLLWSIPRCEPYMRWGRVATEVIKARQENSNFHSLAIPDEAIWSGLRSSRKERRRLQDSLYEADLSQQNAALLQQSYFCHTKALANGLERYSIHQDLEWHLAKWAKPELSENAKEAGEQALDATSKLMDNFHDALHRTTLRLFKQYELDVPSTQWATPPVAGLAHH